MAPPFIASAIFVGVPNVPPQPSGFVDAIEVAGKKLTIQTEYFARPKPRAETKIYLGGALKKIYNEELGGVPSDQLQKAVAEIHQAKIKEIVEGLRQKRDAK